MPTILIVEDEPNQRLLYRMALEDEGYKIVEAAEGREALIQVLSESPDLVVLDLQMPGMDGIDTLWRILGLDAEIPVIIHSCQDRYRENYMTWVADAFVSKSSDLAPLKEVIADMLRKKIPTNSRIRQGGNPRAGK